MGHPSAFQSNEPQQPDRQLQLVVHAGPLAGKGFPITRDTLTFGRDPDNDITLDDVQVSRHHARLVREGDQLILEDLGSTNGTLVNGKPIEGWHTLQPADIISIGSSVFGVKGFVAPHTVGITQMSSRSPDYSPYAPATPPAAVPESEPVPATSPPASRRSQSAPSRLALLTIGGAIALIVTLLVIAGFTAYFLTQGRGPGVAEIPTVVITAPVDGSQVRVNQPVTIQGTASDPSGVVRVELWVSSLKTNETVSPVAQGQPTFTVSFQWTPGAPGTYTLELRAYNQQGASSAPAAVTVNAISEGGVTDTPTPTLTPEPPTPTAPRNPSLITQADLNVRAGPGTEYDLVGLLPTGAAADIIGQNGNRQWWQIRFEPAPGGVGWVSADPAFSTVSNVENVPVVEAPPTPTGTATNTPIPPTDTPTATPIPPTDTPTPTLTPTATGEPTVIEFNVSPDTIEGGECVTITWNISGVREIYFEEQGVGGVGNVKDCPKETRAYHLRVILKDGSEQTRDKTVTVINPIVSTGIITIDPNQTVDFDQGNIPGDDFLWNVKTITRTFEIQPGIQLAPMPDISSLKNLSLAECAGAPFGVYTYIDASDSPPDPNNALIPGRSACYRTNQGRLGKLRFPEFSTGSLKVEWMTWK